MKAAIYNRWLSTLGGGERYTLAIAEELSRRHDVTLITHEPVSKEELSTRLDSDLHRISLRTVPDCPAEQLTELTREYDFFVNASFRDFFPSRSTKSAAVIYFPPRVDALWVRLKRRLRNRLRRYSLLPSFSSGVCGTDCSRRPFAWHLKGTTRLTLVRSPESYDVRFLLSDAHSGATDVSLFLDGRLIGKERLSSDGSPTRFSVPVEGRAEGLDRELEIVFGGDVERMGPAYRSTLSDLDIAYRRSRVRKVMAPLLLQISGARLHSRSPSTHLFRKSLASYDAIWTISEYSRKWLDKYWGKDCSVLYPCVDTSVFGPARKTRMILSVGRFFVGFHNKQHLVMIRAFKEMRKAGLESWELHLAGGVAAGAAHERYLDEVLRAAEGQPIRVHRGVESEALRRLYAASSIYWHAAGFDQDAEREPEKLEHFGISTLEAMASGSVPVVFDGGGLQEIVEHGRNGYLWARLDELKRLTEELAYDSDLRGRLSSAALEDSRRFDRVHFNARLAELSADLGIRI